MATTWYSSRVPCSGHFALEGSKPGSHIHPYKVTQDFTSWPPHCRFAVWWPCYFEGMYAGFSYTITMCMVTSCLASILSAAIQKCKIKHNVVRLVLCSGTTPYNMGKLWPNLNNVQSRDRHMVWSQNALFHSSHERNRVSVGQLPPTVCAFRYSYLVGR